MLNLITVCKLFQNLLPVSRNTAIYTACIRSNMAKEVTLYNDSLILFTNQ